MAREGGKHQRRSPRVVAGSYIGTLVDQGAHPGRFTGLSGSQQLGVHGSNLRDCNVRGPERNEYRE